ncbi:glycosyltransferase [Spirillospora sp. CA-294931]|uniref:glycosyltransferase n=1 Tax=Spirillospora sp. CA-294931 TaxID=3240042 RepID=UPI003D8D1FD2
MIGYYIHHEGAGHLHRARCLAPRLGEPVTGLSSLPKPEGWPGDWIDLPRDDTGRSLEDVAAGGRLHWAPLHDSGLRTRMALIAGWVAEAAPSLCVVDVSVEVAVQTRLLGVPTVVTAMRGDRFDPAHRLAYDLADGLLAAWPAALPEPGWPVQWTAKTFHSGAFSRFDGRPRSHVPSRSRGRVAMLFGAGGAELTRDQVESAVRATPEWDWTILGGHRGWTADPWPALCSADVVITHAGQNAIAECAAARRPTIVVPQRRPHGEQHATARALRRAGVAKVRTQWPGARDWPGVLADATRLDGRRWALWSPGDGADQAAGWLTRLADRRGATV